MTPEEPLTGTPETDAVTPLARKIENGEYTGLFDVVAKAVAKAVAKKLERDRDKWKVLAAQYSAEREHNAMQGLKYKAERDEAIRDLERDFMPGAYARLKHLQNLERELAEKDKQLAATNMYLEEARAALSGRTVSCSQCNASIQPPIQKP